MCLNVVMNIPKLKKCYHDALEINKETGSKKERSNKLSKLGALYQSVSKYAEAQQCLLEALKISQEIGDKFRKATSYLNLGTVLESVVQLVETKEHYQKQKQKNSLTKQLLAERKLEPQDGEAIDRAKLGTFFLCR